MSVVDLVQLKHQASLLRHEAVTPKLREELDLLRSQAAPGVRAAFDAELSTLFPDLFGGPKQPPGSVTSMGGAPTDAAAGGTRGGAALAFREAQRATQAPLLELSSLCADTVLPELKRLLAEIGYGEARVVVRFIDPARIDRARRTGNDRDAASELWDVVPADASPEVRSERGIRNDQVTYAMELDLTTDHFINHLFDNTHAANVFDPKNEEPSAVAVYDVRKLTRAAEAEFWFDGDPKDAMLLLVEKK